VRISERICFLFYAINSTETLGNNRTQTKVQVR